MRKATSIALLLVALTMYGRSTDQGLVTGYVTDTWCGRKGANDKHAEHARRSVASGVAQYAIYVEAQPATAGTPQRGVLYILSPQSTAAQYVGQRVQVSGTLSATPITRAGQSLAPDAVAAYKDASGHPSVASGATSGTSTAPGTIQTVTPTAARGSTARVQSHEDAPDQTTAVAGVLSIPTLASWLRMKHEIWRKGVGVEPTIPA